MSNHRVDRARFTRIPWFHGKGYIAGESPGLLTVEGVPAKRGIVLIERGTRQVVALTNSASDGTFAIRNLSMDRTYTIYGWDSLNEHNAAIADNITPALMPEFEP